ncbi:pantoate--beta-alanine ligase [Paenibacillus mucilaginosus]|uniref:Pantothenate synthetase n=3 Tax=Paenibacillus mucilaginosus TaxID=61624 RepID=H6NAK5_9BACL|nr:pantoate--beta-alanine ligase [Paenibacillus mucilaginosus]AEI41383.1 PanC [Paenibacillus mucilaginosus KNP414]AFC29930.1 PanC [Paenibacillus mucilaginosus 3016]AFH62117.1 pantoate--beta-alanine ligase [Paenibacillus mucilaginosus K02]MCG7211198.1 pantoate--beta-alanine ligase [Paenibacillus mucilaginosus]WDM30406.1 pantoate--beta-alanine ligase [Paenibacillus mucilaginosus]
METVKSIDRLRELIKEKKAQNPNLTVGFVPTMGFLHRGHASLLEAARRECDLVVLSIFVNPLQFGPNEDFERYPRDEERDLNISEEAGADLVFFPQVEEMYPSPTKTIVSVSGVSEGLCGASRPGHFDGVSTVVTKLFHIVQPDRAYFGLKDAQQVAVIEQMVKDLNMPVTIVPCPIVREADGLALSSRNVYLSEEERSQALVLSAALNAAERLTEERGSGFTAAELTALIRREIGRSPLADIDYAEVLKYPTLEPFTAPEAGQRIIVALAVRFGRTRLIDNRILNIR